MADNRDGVNPVTVPCPTVPDEAYGSADPIATALMRPFWYVPGAWRTPFYQKPPSWDRLP